MKTTIKKQKPLLPTLKERKRYLVFEVVSEKTVSFEGIFGAVKDAFLKLVGVLGAAKAGIMFFDRHSKSRGIIRIANSYVDYLKASFCLINKVSDVNVLIRSVIVSGSLKQAQNKLGRED